jgi:hypothetical protein
MLLQPWLVTAAQVFCHQLQEQVLSMQQAVVVVSETVQAVRHLLVVLADLV